MATIVCQHCRKNTAVATTVHSTLHIKRGNKITIMPGNTFLRIIHLNYSCLVVVVDECAEDVIPPKMCAHQRFPNKVSKPSGLFSITPFYIPEPYKSNAQQCQATPTFAEN